MNSVVRFRYRTVLAWRTVRKPNHCIRPTHTRKWVSLAEFVTWFCNMNFTIQLCELLLETAYIIFRLSFDSYRTLCLWSDISYTIWQIGGNTTQFSMQLAPLVRRRTWWILCTVSNKGNFAFSPTQQVVGQTTIFRRSRKHKAERQLDENKCLQEKAWDHLKYLRPHRVRVPWKKTTLVYYRQSTGFMWRISCYLLR